MKRMVDLSNPTLEDDQTFKDVDGVVGTIGRQQMGSNVGRLEWRLSQSYCLHEKTGACPDVEYVIRADNRSAKIL